MTKLDVPQVGELLRRYLERFEVIQTFGRDVEVEHWFLSGMGTGEADERGRRVGQVVWAYVVEVSNL
jgi:glycylpeptide N-tetradecanoyltransferase